MTYRRPPGAHAKDFANARKFEEEVGSWLGDWKIGNLTSTDKLDWWVPGVYVEVKEKNQVLRKRWHMIPGCDEKDLFVVDELSVRRASLYMPHAYFLIHDVPEERYFLARVDEMFCADRYRLDRVGTTGHRKGKWVVDLRCFRQLENPEEELMPVMLADQISQGWKASHCLSEREVFSL